MSLKEISEKPRAISEHFLEQSEVLMARPPLQVWVTFGEIREFREILGTVGSIWEENRGNLVNFKENSEKLRAISQHLPEQLSERFLDKFSSFFLKFCFGPLSDPRGSFGTKKSAIDVKNAKRFENSTQNHKKK